MKAILEPVVWVAEQARAAVEEEVAAVAWVEAWVVTVELRCNIASSSGARRGVVVTQARGSSPNRNPN